MNLECDALFFFCLKNKGSVKPTWNKTQTGLKYFNVICTWNESQTHLKLKSFLDWLELCILQLAAWFKQSCNWKSLISPFLFFQKRKQFTVLILVLTVVLTSMFIFMTATSWGHVDKNYIATTINVARDIFILNIIKRFYRNAIFHIKGTFLSNKNSILPLPLVSLKNLVF